MNDSMNNPSSLSARYLAAKRDLFDRYYGERLNPEQRRAVFCAKGPLLVLAGAGSGKTTVLVNRISYLVRYGNAYASETVPDGLREEEVSALEAAAHDPGLSLEEAEEILPEFISEPCPPYGVLAITFTNKAAREIRDRLASELSDESITDAIWAGTFHSICVRILHKFGDRLGYTDGFSIYDTDDKRRMLLACMKDLNIDEKHLAIKAVANLISAAKDSLVDENDFEIGSDPREKDVKRIYQLYQQKMFASRALDFDDIIMKTVRLLEEDGEVLSYYQNKFRHILVDEYQDTNVAQFRLVSLLAERRRNIMVVGDDDQSIYRFRGATVENILQFDKTYPDATVVKLEQNYRSTEYILDAANAVIHHNEKRHEKSLWSAKGKGEKITLREAEDQNEEGRYVIEKINADVRSGKHRYSDFAILYRINELSRSMETVFSKSGIPYRVLGGLRFYDRKEVKDMIAYLSLAARSQDNLRLKRVINEPKRKIGAATVDAVENLANQLGIPMFEVVAHADEYPVFGKTAEKLKAFSDLIESSRNSASLPSAIIADLYDRSGYRKMLEDEGFEGEGKIDNVNELIAGALEYEKRCEENGVEPSVAGYLEEIALVSDIDRYDENADAVVMMTVHTAKGLEFPVVFLVGMEDGIFPSSQSMGDDGEISEERRLCYVAITRAKEKLYVTYAKNRVMYNKTNYNILSTFIRDEVPESLIETDRPRSVPPRAKLGYSPSSYRPEGGANGYSGISKEFRRPPELFPKPAAKPKGFGVEKFTPGTRILHTVFGNGMILSAKDLGGDVLYEVRFDSGETKKLMATFAKLKRIED